MKIRSKQASTSFVNLHIFYVGNMMRLISICTLLCYSSLNYGQKLSGIFDMTLGKVISNDTLVMACQSCHDFSDNSVVFYHKLEDDWIIKDSIAIGDYIDDLEIASLAVSDDGNSVGISLVDPNNPFFAEEDDAIIVLKKVNNNWHLALKVEDIINNILPSKATYELDFSRNGELLVISNANTTIDFFPNSTGITTKLYSYNFDQSKYDLMHEFNESITSNARLSLNLLKNDELIAISTDTYLSNPYQFIMYSLQNGLWERDFSFHEPEEMIPASIISSNIDAKRLVVSESFSPFEDRSPYISLYQKDEITEHWELFSNPYYSPYLGYGVSWVTMSDKGDVVAAGFFDQGSLIVYDTTSYVDYVKIDDNGMFKLQHRFAFKVSDDSDKYGLTAGVVEMSNDGKLLMIDRDKQIYVYDMSDFLLNNTEINLDVSTLVYPNPTSDFVFTDNIEFDKVNLLNSAGEFITTFSSKEINVSEYPSDTYMLVFYNDNEHVTTVRLVKI